MMIPFYAVDSNYLDVYLARGASYSVSGIVKRVSVVDGGVKNRGRRGAQATEKAIFTALIIDKTKFPLGQTTRTSIHDL